ncbi:hypothetical protein FACS189413_19320 [Bacteroidia bacterium]|nr:hypothetical protein FACS189413_19320 [Bacteroidia bacterium]
MKYFIQAILFFVMLLSISCEEKEYYQGEFVIINNCREAIDVFSVGRNAPSLPQGYEIHDIVLANERLSLRKIQISNQAHVNDVFVYIKIYKNSVPSAKNPIEQNYWRVERNGDKLIHTLIVDSSFFE